MISKFFRKSKTSTYNLNAVLDSGKNIIFQKPYLLIYTYIVLYGAKIFNI